MDIIRCKKCILPETHPSISFDQNGVCNFCNEYKPITYRGEEALRKILDETISESNWDCLVPLSGGRDSSYTLYQLVSKYGKKVLAYNYDNGFVDDAAKQNIKRIVDKLNVQVVYRKSERNIQCRHVSAILKMNVHKTPGHVMAFLCSGCRNGIWGGAYQVAEKYKIPLIVFGESAIESGGFKKYLIPQFMPTPTEKMKFLIKKPLNFIQRKYLTFLLNKEFPLTISNQQVRKINFFDYEAWDEVKIVSTIKKYLGWRQTAESSWRFDCHIHALVNLMVYQLIGMTEKDELYSRQIREGKLTREQALIRIEQANKNRTKELDIAEKVLNHMGLNKEEKKKILDFCSGPPKLENRWTR